MWEHVHMCRNICRSVGRCTHVCEHVHMYSNMCTCAVAQFQKHVNMCGSMCTCEGGTECTCNNPCINNGVCIDIGTHAFKCNCPPGYTGLMCQGMYSLFECTCNCKNANTTVICSEIKKLSRSNPCFHGGKCVDRAFSSYDCICSPEYTGPDCEGKPFFKNLVCNLVCH